MCNVCQYNYDQFSSLNTQLSAVFEQVSECKTSITKIKPILSTVVICGKGIDKDDINNINMRLETISTGLNSLMKQCSSQMNMIAESCPGADHYKNDQN